MKSRINCALGLTVWICGLALFARDASAKLQVLPDREPQFVFSGPGRKVEFLFHNSGTSPAEANLQLRLFQTSSATVMPVGEAFPWKILTVLPAQTVIESVTLDFPEVRTLTAFQVRCLDDQSNALGQTTVQVCPVEALKQLTALAGEKPVGVLDPENILKPILRASAIAFQDLDGSAGFDSFPGKLVLVGPFSAKEKVPGNLARRISAAAARHHATIIWMQPPGAQIEPLPNVNLVWNGIGRIAVVQAGVVSRLAESPLAQINLLRCVSLAQNHNPRAFNLSEVPP